jgi:gamma-glutamylaminecyclotransferase
MTTMTTTRVFVYGTLKEGFRNFHVNRGRRVPGTFVTVEPLALYVIGEFGLPWLVAGRDEGHPVRGQLFEVDPATLAAMDRLERIDDDGWYRRVPLRVRPAAGGEAIEALVYLGSPQRLAHEVIHHGPLPEYLPEHQALYRKHL